MTIHSKLQPIATATGPTGTVTTGGGTLTILRGMVVSADDVMEWTVGMDAEWVSAEMKRRGIVATFRKGV